MKRVEAVIFDWAGTTVDHGSLAPVRAMTELFARQGISLSDADARRDMGIFKKDHIRRILAMPHVEAAWRDQNGSASDERTVETLFEKFQPLQTEVLEAYSQVIGGTVEITERLQRQGLKVGSTTGYTRPMLDRLLRCAAAQGYRPDAALCPDDTGGGRPYPWMCLRIALEFRVCAAAAVVKVGDTESDIMEGLNAGMWSVGVSASGNEVGMSAAEWEALRDEQRAGLTAKACEKLRAAGAHYVIERVSELGPILEQIDTRLAAGERP
jgi:phosphonoacetaldehyde hydrolase